MGARLVSNLDGVTARMRAVGDKVSRAVMRALEKEAIRVRDEARRRAPLEMGNLEKAIVSERDGTKKAAYIVYVNEAAPDDTGNYTVGDYYLYLHEGFMWKPGPGTVYPRGRKYLERGYNAAIRGAFKRIQTAAASELR